MVKDEDVIAEENRVARQGDERMSFVQSRQNGSMTGSPKSAAGLMDCIRVNNF